jgi:hypothetical protein
MHNGAPMRLHLLIRHDLPTRTIVPIFLSGCEPHNNRARAVLYVFILRGKLSYSKSSDNFYFLSRKWFNYLIAWSAKF